MCVCNKNVQIRGLNWYFQFQSSSTRFSILEFSDKQQVNVLLSLFGLWLLWLPYSLSLCSFSLPFLPSLDSWTPIPGSSLWESHPYCVCTHDSMSWPTSIWTSLVTLLRVQFSTQAALLHEILSSSHSITTPTLSPCLPLPSHGTHLVLIPLMPLGLCFLGRGMGRSALLCLHFSQIKVVIIIPTHLP